MYKLIVDVQHGLSNRLRALGCAMVIAAQSNRKFELIWEADLHCEANYEDLFSTQLAVRKKRPTSLPADYLNYMDDEGPNALHSRVDDTIEKDLYIRSGHWVRNRFCTWPAVASALNKLELLASLRERIENTTVQGCIGVTLRLLRGSQYKHLPWESPTNWSMSGQSKIDDATSQTQPEKFILRMQKEVESRPDTKFFVTADTNEGIQLIRDYFGEKIITLDGKRGDRSIDSIQLALIELILLSKTQKILGSPWSSFSILAAQLSSIPIEYAGTDF